MKTTGITVVLLAALSIANGTLAQKIPAKTAAATAIPDLPKIDAGIVLQELQTARTGAAEPSSQEASPLEVIATFLQLRPGQVSQLEQLLQARQEGVAPRIQQLQVLGKQLDALLNSGANPAQVGLTVIQIHALQQQISQIQQAFVSQLVAMLDVDQLQRLHAVQIAVELQPILPAFRLLFPF